MSWLLILGVALFLCAVFTVLGMWHRSIHSAEDARFLQEMREAEEEGTNQSLIQHPQIDVDHCVGCGCCVQACPEHGVLAVVEGRARLVRASHCVGHGCCEVACPVGALTVGLGDVSMRDDIPVLTDERETTVPGIFIAGELGGIGLIRHAVEQGRKVVETVAQRLKAQSIAAGGSDPVDLLIVGCGPTGIAAALRMHELGLRCTIVDQEGIGGSVRKYPRHKMTLTQPVDLPVYGRMKRTQYLKEELIELWEGVFADAGIEVQSNVKLEDVECRHDGTFSAMTSSGRIHCRYCLLGLGRRGTPRRLGVPGEESERVLYQLIDAADYAQQNLLVVGGGDSAIEAAMALATQPGNKVVLSYRRHAFFRIKQKNRERLESMVGEGRISVLYNSEVQRIGTSESILSIQTEEQRVPADYVFIMVGGEPPYPLLKKIGIRFGGPAAEDMEQGDVLKEAG